MATKILLFKLLLLGVFFASIVTQTQQAALRDMRDVTQEEVLNGQSEKQFKSKTEETKWKLNLARKKILIAKDYLNLALKAKNKHKTAKNTPQNQKEIRDIIRKAEKQILHSGEKMGLSYMHYK